MGVRDLEKELERNLIEDARQNGAQNDWDDINFLEPEELLAMNPPTLNDRAIYEGLALLQELRELEANIQYCTMLLAKDSTLRSDIRNELRGELRDNRMRIRELNEKLEGMKGEGRSRRIH